ncbi:MAG: heme o synthase [Gemmatimonadota bacterium]|nr:heme o synthase [Gemmatimonadota bacterium]
MRDWLTLTKPRITGLVLVTTGVGFTLGSGAGLDAVALLETLLGTALAAGGAGALNQVVERDVDALMARTRNRPIPDGRIPVFHGFVFGLALSLAGTAWLAARSSLLAGMLAAATIVLYVGAYTPLKRRTPANTLVGAVPGAIPPVIGWAAATGSVGPGAGVLFAILYLWQLPHFLAIAWMFREDYAAAGLSMLPVVDDDGVWTGRFAALYTVALIPVSMTLTPLGLTGGLYFFGALVLGVLFLGCGLALARRRKRRTARRLLLASVTYLPLLLTLLVVDRVAA